MEKFLKRKVAKFLREWKSNPDRMPLIIRGPRQVGKTESILNFAKTNYDNLVKINFVEDVEYKDIFDKGFNIDEIIKTISYKNRKFVFEPHKTLIFFDEIQNCPNCATSLKFFKLDGRFDVICSGSMMGINYKEIESNSVGFKEDYEMHPMDFEEFLWAKGFKQKQIDDMLDHMINLKPFNKVVYDEMTSIFNEYMSVGGMPKIVSTFIKNNNYTDILKLQTQILRSYEEDITKYAQGLEKTKILNTYNKIPYFLAQENKRFYITKIAKNARSREYIGTIEWLKSAGIIHTCHCLMDVGLPLKGNANPDLYKVYYMDIGLLIASLDEDSRQDLFERGNFNTFKGALYENVAAIELIAMNCPLYYYKNEKSTLEMDFFSRDRNSLVPIEVKAGDNKPNSLIKLIKSKQYKDIKYGIKFCHKNIGFANDFYTFPYFCLFLLRRYLKTK